MASGLQQCGGRSGYRTPDLFGVNADQIKSNRPGMALVPVKYFGPNDAFDLAMTDLPECEARIRTKGPPEIVKGGPTAES